MLMQNKRSRVINKDKTDVRFMDNRPEVTLSSLGLVLADKTDPNERHMIMNQIAKQRSKVPLNSRS
jgi:hypothetical protein|tara:strand:- start:908 stop:1105 length:198 start_codon:yes stop_codon:yes gene_type:complete